MIFLRKSVEPKLLADNKQVWTLELLNGNDAALIARKYALPSIKNALVAETKGKCAYCESKLLHVSYGDVEHIVPKKVDKALAFEWTNLTLACDICNTKKGAHLDILDPYGVDPVDNFWFYGSMMFTIDGADAEADITMLKLELNRPALLERRNERVRNLERQLKIIDKTPNANVRAALLTALVEGETQDETEFAACNRSFIGFLQSSGKI
jgi:uncharacterized protein (TIGR02646 family)